tara:strand:- start:33068 stop:33361 length:294 start_codon:yes stop_codon:yes gene_type:complete
MSNPTLQEILEEQVVEGCTLVEKQFKILLERLYQVENPVHALEACVAVSDGLRMISISVGKLARRRKSEDVPVEDLDRDTRTNYVPQTPPDSRYSNE